MTKYSEHYGTHILKIFGETVSIKQANLIIKDHDMNPELFYLTHSPSNSQVSIKSLAEWLGYSMKFDKANEPA